VRVEKTARDYFREAYEPPGGWGDQAEFDRAFKALSQTQQGVVAKLGETGSYLHRVEGGFWTYDGCGVNAAGIPNWWVSWQTVRAMERKGLLARSWFYVEEWKDHRGFPERAGR
jgi:hypothetical protein